ncbi:hypothetical protein CNMCM5793_007430 [Aspergillus hiratsukae]|uniref:Ricin B lectin domain-containing protein n=1 Tax=Aspergillus hiratsukae TaxID=1194566 RepID=A0A8H6PJJ7_9EURO|nr:hypothetical protein CNMCM5793_007430 [Aspergillus hiratsukae]KAF7155499.1 hypothetical protein CNMCM6106_004645 [Aspergillus hiratsukae]
MDNLKDGGTYKLVNCHPVEDNDFPVLALDRADNKTILGQKWNNDLPQKWNLCKTGPKWQIRNVATKDWLRVESHRVESDPDKIELQVVQAGPQPYDWLIWPEYHENPVLRIVPPASKRNISLDYFGKPEPGKPIELVGMSEPNEPWDEVRNQFWSFQEVEP